MNLLETESYSDVLTSGRRRKRPKLTNGVNDLSTLLASAEVRGRERGREEGAEKFGQQQWFASFLCNSCESTHTQTHMFKLVKRIRPVGVVLYVRVPARCIIFAS